MSFKVCVLPLVLFSIGVAHAGETVQVAGVPLEETSRAFDPSNHWTRGVEDVLVDWVEKGNAPERLQAEDYPIAAYPDKIGGDAVTGWCVKPFGRLGIPRRDALYTHGRE